MTRVLVSALRRSRMAEAEAIKYNDIFAVSYLFNQRHCMEYKEAKTGLRKTDDL